MRLGQVETHERVGSGNVRRRSAFPTAKMRSGSQAWEEAIGRALAKIDLQAGDVALDKREDSVAEKTGISSSYPGLSTTYRIHHVHATLRAKLDSRVGYGEGQFATHDGNLVHYWAWMPLNMCKQSRQTACRDTVIFT